jgi:pyruvate,water dikinase
MGDYTVKLIDVNSGPEKIGLKAVRIGEMLRGGLPIPSGFVVTTDAYVKFLRHNKIANKISTLLEQVQGTNIKGMGEWSDRISNLISNGTMPDFIERELKEQYQDLSIGSDAKEIGGAALDLIRAGRDNIFVAVRPSPSSGGIASANFTGQMQTSISVRGLQNIVQSVKECWSSLFSPRAMLYRKRKRITDMPVMGVIVQKSIEPDKSGFMYTSMPETNDSSRIIIEGSWGYGGIISSGMVNPDEYVIDKESGNLVTKQISKKLWQNRRNEMTGKIVKEPVFRERVGAELLDNKEISKLRELALRAENGFSGHPQEIEWCEERGRLFILDSGPIPNYGVPAQEQDQADGQANPSVSGLTVFRGKAEGVARLVTSLSEIDRIEKGDILVTRMTVKEMLPVLDRLSGIIADDGSRSCYAAVIAREFEIPCIVGAGKASETLADSERVHLDAGSGSVFRVQPEVVVPEPQFMGVHDHTQPQINDDSIPGKIPGGLSDEGITATGIKAIVSIPEKIGNAVEVSDGVGLVRAERIITETGRHPFYLVKQGPEEVVKALVSGLGNIAKSFYPKPVWYKSIDIRTDEFRELEGGDQEPTENNPIMGWHGIRRSLDQPELLKMEIEIIRKLYQEGIDNIVLGLPFISSVEELRSVKSMADFPIKIGIMIETPASGLEIENFCKEGISFAAIGLNDLTQLSLGVDRDNERISRLYSEVNPAVINLLKHILRTCRSYSVETSVYGDFVSDPAIVESLVSLGVGSISVDIDNLENLRSIISRAERRLILENLRNRYPK